MQFSKMSSLRKKPMKKALIPLPPTDFVSFFCAVPDALQTHLRPTRAMGLGRGLAISFCAEFCKELQRGRTETSGLITEGWCWSARFYWSKTSKNGVSMRFQKQERSFSSDDSLCDGKG